MSWKPTIGITMTQEAAENQFEVWQEYIDAIVAGGGIPILLPSESHYNFYEEYLGLIDGLLLSGGQDILPNCYGEESIEGFKLDWEMTPDRDEFEIEMTKKAMNLDMPILGICRGIQILAVANGGSLYQDIEAEIERDIKIRHYQESPWWFQCHKVSLIDNSIISNIYQKRHLETNSLHHQSVKKVPEGFNVTAVTADGVVEAMESLNHTFILGVQWHPERLLPRNKKWALLFKSFCQASINYHLKQHKNGNN